MEVQGNATFLDLNDPKKKAFFMRVFWAISTFMLLFGFLIMLLYWNA